MLPELRRRIASTTPPEEGFKFFPLFVFAYLCRTPTFASLVDSPRKSAKVTPDF
jgi:hypothetical protein